MNNITSLLQKGSLYIEILTAIVATIYFYKYKSSHLKFILPLLWYIVLNEILGWYLHAVLKLKYNAIIYNIYGLISFVLLLNIYRLSLLKVKFKKYLFFFTVSYVIIFIINAFFIDFTKQILTISYIYGSIVLIISILFYLIEILNSERILLVSKEILFWISVGLFLFQIGIIPYMVIREYYIEHVDMESNLLLYYILIYLLNICYIVGFIWGQKQKKQ